jgi:hypothetical protein
LAFRVAKDGFLQNIQVKRGVSGGCTEEAIRVVQGMPKWIPATKKGSQQSQNTGTFLNKVIHLMHN